MTTAERKRPMRERRKLVRAELLMHLATSAERWKDAVLDRNSGLIPVADWPVDDPLIILMSTYDLSAAQLAQEIDKLGDFLESKAEQTGYADYYEHVVPKENPCRTT